MNFGGRVRDLGPVDIDRLREKVLVLSDDDWNRDTFRQETFDYHSKTNSVICQFISDSEDHRSSRYTAEWDTWKALISPVIKAAVSFYGFAEGATSRIMLVRLPAGARVARHWDSGKTFDVPHRIHVPLQTAPEVEFFVYDRPFTLEAGRAYEINNKLYHEVRNNSSIDRIHLIFDYYDGAKNIKEEVFEMAIKLDTTISRNMEIVASDIDGETVMMSVETGKYFGLDPVGSRIWEFLTEPKPVDVLISDLTKAYDVPEDQCRKDTMPFLEKMVEKGILRTAD